MRNPYEVLGLRPQASLEEIKAAYKRKAQAAHPDREGGSAEEMESLTWGILQDVDKRAFWDAFGAELGPEGLAGEGVSGSIPRVLVPLPPNSPISTERALKQVLKLLEGIEGVEDWVQASIDDVTVMLKCIK